MRAFADALDSVPMALAENSGLSPIETLANIKSRQAKEKNYRLGVDCMQTGSNGKCAPSLVVVNEQCISLVSAASGCYDSHRRSVNLHDPTSLGKCVPRCINSN